MIRRIILAQLGSFERNIGVSVEWARHVLRHSLRLFLKFLKFGSFAQSRRALPLPAWHVAQIVAVRSADCGPCVQIAVNLALKEGADRVILQAVIDRKPETLPSDLADIYHFAEAVMAHTGAEDDLREKIRARHGEQGLIELSYALGSGTVIPTIKRALGYAVSCSKVQIKT